MRDHPNNNTTRATANDAGRIESERTMESSSSLSRWLENMRIDGQQVSERLSQRVAGSSTNTNTAETGVSVDLRALKEVQRAAAVQAASSGRLRAAERMLKEGMSAEEVGNRMLEEERRAKKHLTGEKAGALKVSGDTTTWGKVRAQKGVMEFAKGGPTMPVAER